MLRLEQQIFDVTMQLRYEVVRAPCVCLQVLTHFVEVLQCYQIPLGRLVGLYISSLLLEDVDLWTECQCVETEKFYLRTR